MDGLLWVGLGGMLGSMGRYLLNLLLIRGSETLSYPLGILAVNVIGCLVGGFLAGRAHLGPGLARPVQLFLVVGILGGFTTFSAFGIDTFEMLRNGQLGRALLNVTLNLLIGVGAVAGGFAIASRLGGSS